MVGEMNLLPGPKLSATISGLIAVVVLGVEARRIIGLENGRYRGDNVSMSYGPGGGFFHPTVNQDAPP